MERNIVKFSELTLINSRVDNFFGKHCSGSGSRTLMRTVRGHNLRKTLWEYFGH